MAAKTLSPLETIKALLTDKTELAGKLSAATGEIEKFSAEVVRLSAELETLRTQAASERELFAAQLQAETAARDEARARIAALTEQLAAKESALTETISSLGFPAAQLPQATGDKPNDNTLTKAEFDALTPAEKMKFSSKGGRIRD